MKLEKVTVNGIYLTFEFFSQQKKRIQHFYGVPSF
jgi:hypothetical protein